MQERVPVTIISGFLGSGKTTLLNRLLRSNAGLRLAVVVNEFGDVGIDANLVAGGEQFVELDNGCLCCMLNKQLEELLRDLKSRGGFDRLLVETTGLAEPVPVAWTFERPGLCDFYRTDAVVTVVDAPNLERALAEAAEASVQIAQADVLVLNKVDLAADGGESAERRVRALNETAPVFRTTYSEIPWSFLLSGDDSPRLPPEAPPRNGRSLESRFESWSFETDEFLDPSAVEDLAYGLPRSVYRMKALARIRGTEGWTVLHSVAGRFTMAPIEPRTAPGSSRMVFIGQGLDPNELSDLCKHLVSGG